MNNQITTLSRERLENLASGNAFYCIQDDEGKEMARALLAVMDAKPTCWEIAGQIFSTEEEALKPGYVGRPEPLYETPPLPSAPDGWIKCSDRMPDYGRYLVKYSNPLGQEVVTATWRKYQHSSDENSSVDIWNDDRSRGMTSMKGVTHWMPLPAAPE